jgi:hypothetical protein
MWYMALWKDNVLLFFVDIRLTETKIVELYFVGFRENDKLSKVKLLNL